MAVAYSHFAPVPVIQKSVSTKRPSSPSSIVVMCTGNNISINRTPFQIKLQPPTRNKVVFEDQSRGIVCYCDENGEMTCEGIDEGPRFQHRSSSNPRDADIVDLLQKWWYQIAREDDKFC